MTHNHQAVFDFLSREAASNCETCEEYLAALVAISFWEYRAFSYVMNIHMSVYDPIDRGIPMAIEFARGEWNKMGPAVSGTQDEGEKFFDAQYCKGADGRLVHNDSRQFCAYAYMQRCGY